MTAPVTAVRDYLLACLASAAEGLDAWTEADWLEALSDARAQLADLAPGPVRNAWDGYLALLERARPALPRTDDGGEVLDPAILCAACAGQGSVYFSRANVRVPCNSCSHKR